MPDVSSLLSSGKAEREKDAFPRPCLEGVVLQETAAPTSTLAPRCKHQAGNRFRDKEVTRQRHNYQELVMKSN